MLHTVNKSPFKDSALENCLRFAGPGDTILLIEDGVLAAMSDTIRAHLIEGALKRCEVCALRADLRARAIEQTIPGVQVIDYGEFVDLVERHPTQQAWL